MFRAGLGGGDICRQIIVFFELEDHEKWRRGQEGMKGKKKDHLA